MLRFCFCSFPNDFCTLVAPTEVIDIDVVDKADLPNPTANIEGAMQEPSLAGALASSQGTSSGAGVALGTGTSTLMPTPRETTIFSLHHVPEDQTGASKEELIQLELMCDKLKTAYDASAALQKNVRESTLVSTFLIRHLGQFVHGLRPEWVCI